MQLYLRLRLKKKILNFPFILNYTVFPNKYLKRAEVHEMFIGYFMKLKSVNGWDTFKFDEILAFIIK